MATAFQPDAFQDDAFQIDAGASTAPAPPQREVLWGVPVTLRRRTPERPAGAGDEDWIVGLV